MCASLHTRCAARCKAVACRLCGRFCRAATLHCSYSSAASTTTSATLPPTRAAQPLQQPLLNDTWWCKPPPDLEEAKFTRWTNASSLRRGGVDVGGLESVEIYIPINHSSLLCRSLDSGKLVCSKECLVSAL